ncbi:UNVERIFIED_CONTAM: Villin-3 [Sesamum calycinum]|uniref:Villin-3 n=1 Tax=Sesamum calycinum TaxID=2727403 RepID=A0AAW2N367_9LAMI
MSSSAKALEPAFQGAGQRVIIGGEVKNVDGELSKSILENNKCYLLDCGAEVFVWVGRVTQVDERKAASQVAEDFLASQNRPKSTHITRLIQGYETHSFKSNFDSWPLGSAPSVAEEGRGKVAALLKQQGVGIKGASKSAPVNEEVPPLLEGGGKREVWYINDNAKTPVPNEDIGKFYSGDCYIVLYTYHSHERKEDYYLCCWIGKDSIEPGSSVKHTKEGTESSSFWFALGGKQNYTSKKLSPEVARDPHLFEFSFRKGRKFSVEEIYNFSQDDLLTEDILILDTHAEVFVWIGQSVDPKEKQHALEIGQAYLSDEEFQSVLGMDKDAFYKLPKWKQDMLKRKVDLF